MGRGKGIRTGGPIVIPRLDDPDSASVDERDEHLMLLEAARHTLEAEWTKTLAAFKAAEKAPDEYPEPKPPFSR